MVIAKVLRVNMNKTKVMISGERQIVWQKAARWPCGVCNKGVGVLDARNGYIRNVVV